MIAERWRAARSAAPPGHLDAAGCNVPSDRVLEAVVEHLRQERERGGYAAVPGFGAPKAALAALVGADGGDVAFLESGTAAMAALLGGWRLPPGARVGFTRSEYGSTLMLLRRLAAERGWALVELPADGHARLDLDALSAALAGGLDLVTLPHLASHRGTVQPAAEAGRLCREAGVPLVLDVCQSLGHLDVTGVGAAAYVGTSRKWLAGPRGVGFLVVPAPTADMDAAAPTLAGHEWTTEPPEDHPREPGPLERAARDAGALRAEPLPGAVRYESAEAAVAARVGFGVAVLEHHALGPAAMHAHLAGLGAAARHALDGRGGWRVVEPFDEPSALVTLRPPPGADAARTGARAAEEGVPVGVVPVARAPLDLHEPVLRVSPSPDTVPETLETLARLLEKG